MSERPSERLSERVGDWPPAVFERQGREVLAMIRDHFESIRQVPVTVPKPSADLMESLRAELPEEGKKRLAALTKGLTRESRKYVVLVAESGIASAEDVRRARDAGADAVLVGEALMRAAEPGRLLAELVAAGETA